MEKMRVVSNVASNALLIRFVITICIYIFFYRHDNLDASYRECCSTRSSYFEYFCQSRKVHRSLMRRGGIGKVLRPILHRRSLTRSSLKTGQLFFSFSLAAILAGARRKARSIYSRQSTSCRLVWSVIGRLRERSRIEDRLMLALAGWRAFIARSSTCVDFAIIVFSRVA